MPTRRRLDVDALYRMAEAGILAWGERVELIDGEIIDKGPIGSDHGGMTDRLARLIIPAVAGHVAVGIQRPVRLDPYNEPQPDVVLMRPRADDYRSGHPTADDVLLIVEVANSSLAFDRGTKLPLYARFVVPEVWIVDLAGAAVEVHRAADAGSYRDAERLTAGTLAPPGVPDLAIDVAALLA